MSHVILISPDRSQIETHEVDADLFCKVWDLVHAAKQAHQADTLSFGAASRLEAVQDAMANSTDLEPEIQPEPDPKPYHKPAPVAPVTAPVSDDQAFAASLAALFN